MEDITLKEIKGISARNLFWLLSSVIMIEFTIIMSYTTIMNNQKDAIDRLDRFERVQNKLMDHDADGQTQIRVLQTEIQTLKRK